MTRNGFRRQLQGCLGIAQIHQWPWQLPKWPTEPPLGLKPHQSVDSPTLFRTYSLTIKVHRNQFRVNFAIIRRAELKQILLQDQWWTSSVTMWSKFVDCEHSNLCFFNCLCASGCDRLESFGHGQREGGRRHDQVWIGCANVSCVSHSHNSSHWSAGHRTGGTTPPGPTGQGSVCHFTIESSTYWFMFKSHV